jgi:hypothetical protein
MSKVKSAETDYSPDAELSGNLHEEIPEMLEILEELAEASESRARSGEEEDVKRLERLEKMPHQLRRIVSHAVEARHAEFAEAAADIVRQNLKEEFFN